jgi:hypothetical protein
MRAVCVAESRSLEVREVPAGGCRRTCCHGAEHAVQGYVINVLVKHSAVFEHEPIPPDIDPTLATDIEALMHVFYVERGPTAAA